MTWDSDGPGRLDWLDTKEVPKNIKRYFLFKVSHPNFLY